MDATFLKDVIVCPPSSLVCIEYPGIVKNVDKMLETLGGVQQFSKVLHNQLARIELRFRPKDLFAHCAFGDRHQVNSLMVKAIKKRYTFADGRTEIRYETYPIGVIETVYKFKSLGDFQYLPMKRCDENLKKSETNVRLNVRLSNSKELENLKQPDPSLETVAFGSTFQNSDSTTNFSPRYESLLHSLVVTDPFSSKQTVFNEKTPLMMMPVIFSRFDASSSYFYRNDPKHRDKSIAEEIERQNRLSIIGRNRKPRCVLAYLIHFSDPVPAGPEKPLALAKIDSNVLAELDRLFNDRPIWSKNAIMYHLHIPRSGLRFALSSRAFFYYSGPFRGLWVKFGYDPKQHPECKIYQTLDFRLKQVFSKKLDNDSNSQKRIRARVSMKKSNQDKKARVPMIEPTASTSRKDPLDKDKDSMTCKHENAFIFRKGIMPLYRQIFYQLCDIHVEEITELVHQNDNEEQTCTEKDGWLIPGTIDKIRTILSKNIDKTLEELEMKKDFQCIENDFSDVECSSK